jgi:signal transduction histidine kinase
VDTVRYQPEGKARLPRWLIALVVTTCVAPLPLAWLGVDFGASQTAGGLVHLVLQWTACCAAIVTALLAAVHYRITRDVTMPVIGTTLLCAGAMDAGHTLAAVRLLADHGPAWDLIPYTWALARLFATVVMSVAAALLLLRNTTGPMNGRRFAVVVVVASCLLALMAINVGNPIQHLTQILPLMLLVLVATPLLCVLHIRQRSLFTHALAISLIPAVASQAYMAFGSAALFDASFNIAHALKIVAYAVPLCGLILDYERAYREKRSALEGLADSERIINRANHDLREANRELEQFVHTVSHDLKSPIVTIQGFVGHLQRDLQEGRTDRLDDFAGRISNASTRMRSNIDDLLQLSRVGRVNGPFVWLDMDAIVQEMIEDHATEIGERGVSITVDELPPLRSDRMRIAQLFDNLIVNALKHGSTAERPAIHIGAECAGGEHRYFVRDNGAGIPEEDRERVFELFRRLDHRSDGSGIGLALVKRIAEVHGGRVWIESEPDAGTTFRVAFPLETAVPDDVVSSLQTGTGP